ncbi:MAG: TetR/AcrR family transcriptional regulator [Acidimicrobiales bacterium]
MKAEGPPKLRADARRNREMILSAASEVFAEDGPGVPVDEIARRAGVGAGTLYRHFPTKEALFAAVLEAHMARLVERAADLAEREDADVALCEFVSCLGAEAASKKSLIEALAGSGIEIDHPVGAKRALEEGFSRLLSRAQATGRIRSDVTVHELFYLVMGTCPVANHAAGDAAQARMLSIVCDGLRVDDAHA